MSGLCNGLAGLLWQWFAGDHLSWTYYTILYVLMFTRQVLEET